MISIDSNITDNIIRKVISLWSKKSRFKNGALRNSSINRIFLWKRPIQNHSKPSITEKRKNKAKYLTLNSITIKLVKKTSMPNPLKSLGYIKWYSSGTSRPVKSPSNSIWYNCQKICCWSRGPKTILEIRKAAIFL